MKKSEKDMLKGHLAVIANLSRNAANAVEAEGSKALVLDMKVAELLRNLAQSLDDIAAHID